MPDNKKRFTLPKLKLQLPHLSIFFDIRRGWFGRIKPSDIQKFIIFIMLLALAWLAFSTKILKPPLDPHHIFYTATLAPNPIQIASPVPTMIATATAKPSVPPHKKKP